MNDDSRKVLIYCRESRDDDFSNYDRIETQRDQLLNFCKNRGYTNIIDIIMDDNVSGTDFTRFENVIQMAENKEFDLVVFKDASRLGRNLLESLKFIEKLKSLRIDILFETEEFNEDIFPLKAWFNEQRAKEDSKKIRHVLKYKMESGELLIKPVYGYKKEAGNLLIQPYEAKIVKRIFDLYEMGMKTSKIAELLNTEGVETPSMSKNLKKYTNIWNRQHILRILDNEIYTGTMIYGKRERISYKNKSLKENSPSDWIVIKDHHEAIISEQQFEKVKELRKKRINGAYQKKERPFSGILKCGKCGSDMIIRCRKNREDYYICGKYHREGSFENDKGCFSHVVYEKELYNAVQNHIEQLLRENGEIVQAVLNGQEHKKNKEQILKKQKQYRNIISKIYDDRLEGIIDEHMFIEKKEKYELCIREAEQYIQQIDTDIENTHETDTLMAKIDIEFIDRTIISTLFSKIIIYMPHEIKPADYKNLKEEEGNYLSQKGGILFL